MIEKIKTYTQVFGQKIEPSESWLPPIYYPSDNGWIATIQETFAPDSESDPNYTVLSILSEHEFQSRFGKRRIMQEFKNVVNFWREYGIESQEQASTFMNEAVCTYVSHRLPEWEKMYLAITEEYDPLENYSVHDDTTETLTKEGTEETAKTGSESNEKTGTESVEKQGSEIDTPAGTETVTVNNNFNGFNSSQSVPVSDSTETTSFTNRNNTRSFNQRKDVQSFQNRKDTLSFTDRKDTLSFDDRTDTRTIKGHKHGYYGVSSIQTIINAELRMRLYDLATVIYKDIADHFLLSVY